MMDFAQPIALSLHLLAVAFWVGGMAFALVVLRPSLAILPPAQRLSLHAQVFQRFFGFVWLAMPLTLLSGFAMIWIFGGFADVNPGVHAMTAIGLLMAVIFVAIFFGPWRSLRAALAAADTPAAAAAVTRIRHLVMANLCLGAVTIVIAAFA